MDSFFVWSYQKNNSGHMELSGQKKSKQNLKYSLRAKLSHLSPVYSWNQLSDYIRGNFAGFAVCFY